MPWPPEPDAGLEDDGRRDDGGPCHLAECRTGQRVQVIGVRRGPVRIRCCELDLRVGDVVVPLHTWTGIVVRCPGGRTVRLLREEAADIQVRARPLERSGGPAGRFRR